MWPLSQEGIKLGEFPPRAIECTLTLLCATCCSVVGDGTPSADIARLLNKQIMVLYADFVSDDGNGVAYDDLRTSAAFADYVNNSAQLQVSVRLSAHSTQHTALSQHTRHAAHGHVRAEPTRVVGILLEHLQCTGMYPSI